MDYTLTSPCKDCPFRKDVKPYLTLARVHEILGAITEQQATFSCHASNEIGEDDEVVKENQHCAGAMILLEKIGTPNQMMRISERLGMYDHRKLKMDAPVYASPGAMIRAYSKRNR